MSTKKPNSFFIYDSRIATLISPNSEKLVSTQANFLKPCSKNTPTSLHHSQTVSQINHHHPKIHFKGWKNPQTKWGDWVETLTAEQAFKWNQTGLCDALLSSLYHFPRNPSLVLALVQHWSPKTNTFVFPWGEATITLEDVMILGGFSVLGESVKLPLSSDLLLIEAKLIDIQRRLSKGKSKKADHNTWLKFFKEGLEEEKCELFDFEHVGFLCLWLSRFVFPSCSDYVIDPRVFPIAIHLSQGKRVALAPSVLSSIYHNLSLLKEKIVSSSVKDLDLKVNGLFQLVQQWLFERFPILGPKYPNELKNGEPRGARWHKLNSESEHASFEFIMSKLESEENFCWRPYVVDLKNWCFESHYKENEQFVVDGSTSNCDLADELKCFGVCLCADEVVGLDCVEKYMPYRVAMQFGMDQDVPPNEFTVISPCYNENFSFYVPSRCYKPSVSLEYHNWWKKSKVIPGKNVDDFDLGDVVMIAQQYCEDENHASIAFIESGSNSKRKSSSNEEISKDNEVKSNSSIAFVGEDLVVEEGKRLKKNEESLNCGFNNDVGECEVMIVDGKGKKELGVGSYDNPLDVEDYGCTILGTSSHPIRATPSVTSIPLVRQLSQERTVFFQLLTSGVRHSGILVRGEATFVMGS